jgi:tetratricopeptide (TPR) repeat protein
MTGSRRRPVLLVAALSLSMSVSVSAASVEAQTPAAGKGVDSGLPAGASAELKKLADQAQDARSAGRLDEAVRLYWQAIEMEPTWTSGWWSLGTMLYSLERFEEARDMFRRVVGLAPDDANSWALKGLCEFELKSYDRALSDLQRARLLGLENKEIEHVAGYHLGTLLTRYEQYEASLELLADLTRQGNESASLVEALGLSVLRLPYLPNELPARQREMVLMAGRATKHWAHGRREPARLGFEELLLRYPEERNVHYAFGVFLLREDQDRALQLFERELEINPYHVESMLQIALERIVRGDLDEAKELAEKAVELAPQNAAGQNTLGRVLLQTGDVEGAIEHLERGVAIAPTSRQMRFELARAYTRAGRTEDAAREREEFRKLDEAERARASGTPMGGDLGRQAGGQAPE